MMISKVALPRRTVLRGIGAALALPLLDAMVPALSAASKTAANPVPRVGFIYLPNGQALENFIPTRAGTDFDFSPTLKPLETFRSQLTVVSGLSNLEAESRGLTTGPHTRGCATWLNGVRPRRTEGADVRAGKTIDQFAADKLGADTALRSLEICRESNFNVGNCDNGYSCAYVNTTSWRTATMPLPMENNPRVVFERLFGDGETVSERRGQMRRNRSLLDSVIQEISSLQKTLGSADRLTVSDHIETVREVEQRIQKAEESALSMPSDLTAPLGIPVAYEDHINLLFDLMALAYRSDVTRVVAFQLGREQSAQTYPWIGVPEADHDVSHHGPNLERLTQRTKINTYHASLFARFLEKMRATTDGDGSLLDHSMILYGAGMGDGSVHSCHNLPIVLAGGGCGQLEGGRHVALPIDTPMMNLGLTLLDKVGVEVATIGDSTGRLTGL